MPNKDIHRPIGMAVGGGFALWGAQQNSWSCITPEVTGGIAGGWLGAAIPDWIDPPTCPNHRHVGHGAVTVVGAIWLSADAALDAQRCLCRRADALALARLCLESDVARFLNWFEECVLRFLAGLLNGLAAGYISHLVLDSLAARGIPLFVRGC